MEDETSEDDDEVKCPELTDCDVDSLGCEHGLKQDESGCDTCACHICGPVCLMRCEHGFTMDERNCSQCRCASGKFDHENWLLMNYVLTDNKILVQRILSLCGTSGCGEKIFNIIYNCYQIHFSSQCDH